MPVLKVFGGSVVEPLSGSRQLGFDFELDTVATTPVAIRYFLVDSTALGGTDYYRDSGTFTIQAGQSTGTLNVTVYDDTSAASIVLGVDRSWHVVDTGDFNGDGRSDIPWHNDNGVVADWLGMRMAASPATRAV